MIRNPDGTPYSASGDFSQYDPTNPDKELFNLWDQELIRISGTPIFYFEVFIPTETIDPIYLESRNKIFATNPIKLYALYEPIPSQNSMGVFGIDAPDEMLLELNYSEVLSTLGHMPKIGSRILTPHLNENWKIVQNNLGEFKLWGAMRLQIMVQKFQESTTTGEGKVTQKNNFSL